MKRKAVPRTEILQNRVSHVTLVPFQKQKKSEKSIQKVEIGQYVMVCYD
jgi:hypothetical protein